MKGISIVSTGRCLPKKQVSNDDLSKIVDTNDEWITTRTGIKNRYKCEEETCADLAINASKAALEKAGIDKSEIGLIIVATTTPTYMFPSTACLIQEALGIDENVMAFDLNAACSGFLMALGSAAGILQNLQKKYAIIVGAEALSNIVDYNDRGTCILFGDGAAAAVVKSSDNEFYQKSFARGDKDVLFCKGPSDERQYLNMLGSDVFKFAVNALPHAIDEVLKDTGKTLDDIDYVVCHQANKRIIAHVQKKYSEYADKFYINIENYGNTSAASIPIALDEMMEQGLLKKGMKILSVGFGAGLTWCGTLLEI